MKSNCNLEHRRKRRISKPRRLLKLIENSKDQVSSGSKIIETSENFYAPPTIKRRRLVSKVHSSVNSETCCARSERKSFHSLNLPSRKQHLLDCQVRRRALSDTARTLHDSLSPYYTALNEKRKTKLPSKYDHMFLLGLSRRRMGSGLFERISGPRSVSFNSNAEQNNVVYPCDERLVDHCEDKVHISDVDNSCFSANLTPSISQDDVKPKSHYLKKKRESKRKRCLKEAPNIESSESFVSSNALAEKCRKPRKKRCYQRKAKICSDKLYSFEANTKSSEDVHKARTIKITKLSYTPDSSCIDCTETGDVCEKDVSEEKIFSLPCITDVEISASAEWNDGSADTRKKGKCKRKYTRRKPPKVCEKVETRLSGCSSEVGMSSFDERIKPAPYLFSPSKKRSKRNVTVLRKRKAKKLLDDSILDIEDGNLSWFTDNKQKESFGPIRKYKRRKRKLASFFADSSDSVNLLAIENALIDDCESTIGNSKKSGRRRARLRRTGSVKKMRSSSNKCNVCEGCEKPLNHDFKDIKSYFKSKRRKPFEATGVRGCDDQMKSRCHSRLKKGIIPVEESLQEIIRKCLEEIVDCISFHSEKRGPGRPRKTLIERLSTMYPDMASNLLLESDFSAQSASRLSSKPRKKSSILRLSVSETNSTASLNVSKVNRNSVQHRTDVEQNGGESAATSFEPFTKPRPSDLPAKDIEVFDYIMSKFSHNVSNSAAVNLPDIVFGEYEIRSWYRAPYPAEYANVEKLYICEFCLTYMKSERTLARHNEKCESLHPPGNQIYVHRNLSVFEVDGKKSTNYCQNLCLLAKLFLDHKTLHSDVEPFLFYVLTKFDEFGHHLIGYFSKEKLCLKKFNVSCIMVLPQYQRMGYGTFLIDFSYLLSRKEGLVGTPERPLSDLGKLSYESYWKMVILRELQECKSAISFRDLSNKTAITVDDIFDTVRRLNLLSKRNNEFILIRLTNSLPSASSKWNIDLPTINESCLRWTPPVFSNENTLEDLEENEVKAGSEVNTRLLSSFSTADRKIFRRRSRLKRRGRKRNRRPRNSKFMGLKCNRKRPLRKKAVCTNRPTNHRTKTKLITSNTSDCDAKSAVDILAGNAATELKATNVCDSTTSMDPVSDLTNKEADNLNTDESYEDVLMACNLMVDSISNQQPSLVGCGINDTRTSSPTNGVEDGTKPSNSTSDPITVSKVEIFDSELDDLVADIFEIEERERRNSETSQSSKSRSRTPSINSSGCISSSFSTSRSSLLSNANEPLSHHSQSNPTPYGSPANPSNNYSPVSSPSNVVSQSPPIQSRYSSRSCSPIQSNRCISTPSPGVIARPSSTSPGLTVPFTQNIPYQLTCNKQSMQSVYPPSVDYSLSSSPLRLPYDQNFSFMGPRLPCSDTPSYFNAPFISHFSRPNVFVQWQSPQPCINNPQQNFETFQNIYAGVNPGNMNAHYVRSPANTTFPFAGNHLNSFAETGTNVYRTNMFPRPVFNRNEIFHGDTDDVYRSNFGEYPPK